MQRQRVSLDVAEIVRRQLRSIRQQLRDAFARCWIQAPSRESDSPAASGVFAVTMKCCSGSVADHQTNHGQSDSPVTGAGFPVFETDRDMSGVYPIWPSTSAGEILRRHGKPRSGVSH